MNIVLISMDCVRPDYLISESFKRLKKESMVFTQCIAQAPHTSTSHASILTGMYPFHHGVRWLVDFKVQAPMLQEIMRERRYRTAAFIGGFPLSQGNLNRGFDIFRYDPVCEDKMEGRGCYTPANVLVSQTASWLLESPGIDHFVFLHFFDAHLTLRAEKGDTSYKRRVERYKEEIDFIGHQVELLLDLADVDLLIITSDHGEKMRGEKNYPWVTKSNGERISSHFHEAELYDIQLKVPLFIMGNKVRSGEISKQVRSIDIFPTILEYAGFDLPPVDGASLLHGSYPEYAYSETYFAQLVDANRHCYDMNKRYDWGWKGIDSLVSLRSNKWKLICTANGEIIPYMLFDIENDSSEEDNLIQEVNCRGIAAHAENELRKLIADDRQFEVSAMQVESSIAEKLKLLGYL